HQVGAQLLHQVELALGAVEVLLQAVAAAALEIAKRLEQGDGDAKIGAHLADLTGAAGVVQKIVLEDLDAVETGGGNGFELFRQGTAQGHGGDRTLHGWSSLLLERGLGPARTTMPKTWAGSWHDRLLAGKVTPAIYFVRNS